MSRKPRISTDGAPPLSSNPFAALEGAREAVPAAEDSTPAPLAGADAPAATTAPPQRLGREKIVVRREKKGRGGKTATVIEGLRLDRTALDDAARRLRRALGCGAHVEGSTIVLTGAQTTRVRDWLAAEGATTVIVGN